MGAVFLDMLRNLAHKKYYHGLSDLSGYRYRIGFEGKTVRIRRGPAAVTGEKRRMVPLF